MTTDKKITTETDEKKPDDESTSESPAVEGEEIMTPNNRHQTIEPA
jgi:hypothetical protein